MSNKKETRGGARKNAGAPPKGEAKLSELIQTKLTKADFDKAVARAKNLDLTLSEFVRFCVLRYLP